MRKWYSNRVNSTKHLNQECMTLEENQSEMTEDEISTLKLELQPTTQTTLKIE